MYRKHTKFCENLSFEVIFLTISVSLNTMHIFMEVLKSLEHSQLQPYDCFSRNQVSESWERAEKQLEAENTKSVWSTIIDGVGKVATGAAKAVSASYIAMQRNKGLLPSDDVIKEIFKGAQVKFLSLTNH